MIIHSTSRKAMWWSFICWKTRANVRSVARCYRHLNIARIAAKDGKEVNKSDSAKVKVDETSRD